LLEPEDGGIMIPKILGSTEPVVQHPVTEDNLHLRCCENVRFGNVLITYAFL